METTGIQAEFHEKHLSNYLNIVPPDITQVDHQFKVIGWNKIPQACQNHSSVSKSLKCVKITHVCQNPSSMSKSLKCVKIIQVCQNHSSETKSLKCEQITQV